MSTNTNAPNIIDYTSEFSDALALLGRIAVAFETVAEEAVKQTPLIERIAVADEGVWQCCRSGRGDQEAFVEINMRYHDETPEQRWERYEAFLMRGANIPNETP